MAKGRETAREFTLRDEVLVRAPMERVFLLSTSIAIVQEELRMKPVAGRTSGFVIGGDRVLWRGWKFGLPQFHQSLITAWDRNRFFQDTMIAGRFKTFQHDHAFEQVDLETVRLSDELRFSMPLGWAGALVGRLVLVPHIRKLMKRRFALIKQISETERWRRYIESPAAAS
jgi:ligand-binding SRPBCC domain-containing protein